MSHPRRDPPRRDYGTTEVDKNWWACHSAGFGVYPSLKSAIAGGMQRNDSTIHAFETYEQGFVYAIGHSSRKLQGIPVVRDALARYYNGTYQPPAQYYWMIEIPLPAQLDRWIMPPLESEVNWLPEHYTARSSPRTDRPPPALLWHFRPTFLRQLSSPQLPQVSVPAHTLTAMLQSLNLNVPSSTLDHLASAPSSTQPLESTSGTSGIQPSPTQASETTSSNRGLQSPHYIRLPTVPPVTPVHSETTSSNREFQPSPLSVSLPTVPPATPVLSPNNSTNASARSLSPADQSSISRSLYIVASPHAQFRLTPMMGWYLLTFHNFPRDEIECIASHLELITNADEGNLIDFQDHLVGSGLILDHALFMMFWIFHYCEEVTSWDDIWELWPMRRRFMQETPVSDEERDDEGAIPDEEHEEQEAAEEAEEAEEEEEEEEEDAMEGPDFSNSLEGVALEDTDWLWARDQYRAYHQ